MNHRQAADRYAQVARDTEPERPPRVEPDTLGDTLVLIAGAVIACALGYYVTDFLGYLIALGAM